MKVPTGNRRQYADDKCLIRNIESDAFLPRDGNFGFTSGRTVVFAAGNLVFHCFSFVIVWVALANFERFNFLHRRCGNFLGQKNEGLLLLFRQPFEHRSQQFSFA